MLIRVATTDDTSAIASVFVEARGTLTFLPAPGSLSEMVALVGRLLTTAEVWVAESDGQVVGFAALTGDQLAHMYVRPACHGNGVGGALFGKVEERRPDGFSLWVFQSNTKARRFYEQRGCRLVKLTDGSSNQERAPDALYEWRAA